MLNLRLKDWNQHHYDESPGLYDLNKAKRDVVMRRSSCQAFMTLLSCPNKDSQCRRY